MRAPGRAAWLVAAAAAGLVGFSWAQTTTTTTTSTADNDVFVFAGTGALGFVSAPLTSGLSTLQISGQGGQITAYTRNDTGVGPSKVVVSVSAIREVDARGSQVGIQNSTKHYVSSFVADAFDVGSPQVALVASAVGQKITVRAPAGVTGQLKVSANVLTQAGPVGPDFSRWMGAIGDISWNINLSAWSFCGCRQSNGFQEMGAYVDIDIPVRGIYAMPAPVPGSPTGWYLGGGVTIELANTVEVDGVDIPMPDGYPRFENRTGVGAVWVIRCARFARQVVYESLLRMGAPTPIVVVNQTKALMPAPIYVSHGSGLAGTPAVRLLKAVAVAAGAMKAAGIL